MRLLLKSRGIKESELGHKHNMDIEAMHFPSSSCTEHTFVFESLPLQDEPIPPVSFD